MGETANQPFQLSSNPDLKIEFQGSWVTSDGGLILVRELDERLGFSDLIPRHVTDPRGKNSQLPLGAHGYELSREAVDESKRRARALDELAGMPRWRRSQSP